MRHTRRATRTTTDTDAPAKFPKGTSVTTTGMKTTVSTARRIVRAISLGVFWRFAPSTSGIMRSMKVWPRSAVIRTTIRSDSTLVPPVTAERSPPDSRITGADSPVIADSSTLRDALDDLAVGRDDVVGLADDDVALGQLRGRDRLLGAVGAQAARRGL